MSTEKDPAPVGGESNVVEKQQPAQAEGGAEAVTLPGFYPPSLIIARLSAIPGSQPVAALAAVNQHRDEMTEVFLKALERGVADPLQDFSKEGMLFNYAAYFLAKWRDLRAYPLFLRWFSLPGEEALELGGDTVTHDGARFLASVCGADREHLKALVRNREANEQCRGQALLALAVLVGWGARPREELEADLLFLAREGLERQATQVWNDLAAVCVNLEFLSVFPDLRRAYAEGLIAPGFMRLEDFEEVERAPRGTLAKSFAERYPAIQDVVRETRWWAGFQRASAGELAEAGSATLGGAVGSGDPYVAPPKVGRNDLCPCGSGKKYKKCCGR
jgi:Protein of unknown function (DUF1186)/SEC-C motif